MTELEKLCEQALYEEIRKQEDGKSIVRDVPTGRLYYRKELTVYNLQVFSYLKEHKSRYVPGVREFREDEEEGKRRLIVIEEFVQGRTLEDILEEAGEPLSFHERIRILTELCDGLSFLHNAQPPIIHRDLKASNIMLTEDGVVKIIDYDAAKVYISGEKKDTVLMGTHGIAAPEQYGFAASDVRTDIFGLGKLIERLLPGNIDAERIVARATHMDPKKRYASAAQIREQIVRIREDASPLDSRFEKVIPGFDPRRKSHRVLARTALALLCAATVLAAGACVWRFRVYPAQRRAAMTADLESMPGRVQNGNAAEAIEGFLETYPYAKMREEEQREFRDAMEKLLSRSSGDNLNQALEVLAENCGGEEISGWIGTYAAAEKQLSGNRFAEAFEILAPLRQEGALDAEEKWQDALARCRTRADVLAEEYEQKQTVNSAGTALKLYALLESAADETAAEAQEAYDSLYRAVLQQADDESAAGEFDDAEKHYALLQEYAEPQSGEPVDPEERIRANTYRKAEAELKEEDYSSARELFAGLGDYSDAAGRASECSYLIAGQHMDRQEYSKAAEAYLQASGYKDAAEKALEAKYKHCESCAEKPDDDAYTYIEELVAAGYPGAQAVRDTIYQWHTEIRNGLSLLMGSQQSSHIRVDLYGGAPGASTRIRLETRDNVSGDRVSWTSPEACSRGGHVDASYNADTFEYSIFEREHTVNAYSEDGELIGTWTGVFTKDFLDDD